MIRVNDLYLSNQKLQKKSQDGNYEQSQFSSLAIQCLSVSSVMFKQMYKQTALSINSVLFCPEARLFSSLFSLSPGLHALHAEDETPGEVKRGAGMEFCSIYHPEIFLLERHTLFSLSPYSLHCFSLCPSPPSHFSSLCVTCGHFTSFQDGLVVL